MPRTLKKRRAKKANKRISGALVIDALKKKFKASTFDGLAKHIGGTSVALWSLSNRRDVTPRQIAELVSRAVNSSGKAIYSPIVEFHHVERHRKHQRFRPLDAEDKKYSKLVENLRAAKGIYFFYDSTGRIMYVGKTEKQNLWDEMTNAFNRENIRNRIYLARHPRRRMGKRSSKSGARRINLQTVRLHDSAYYFSAYGVRREFIGVMERMIIRAVPNNLVNSRIEGQAAR
jgi:hypothetical protein